METKLAHKLSVLTTFTLSLAACELPPDEGEIEVIQRAATAQPGPTPPFNPCAYHATRPADKTITIPGGDPFVKTTVSVPSGMAYEPWLNPYSCPRWVVDVVFPTGAGPDCDPQQPGHQACLFEILAGAGAGPSPAWNSQVFEQHFRTPDEDGGETYCESYRRSVAVYKKLSGQSVFQLADTWDYRGRWLAGPYCQVADLSQGTHDTSEVYTTAIAPGGSGQQNVYRIVQAVRVDGYYRDLVVAAEAQQE